MRKKEYERPTMQVVEVKQQVQLLAGSNQSSMQDYQWHDNIPEE